MDIAGHTALTRGMDPEDQMALVDPLIARLAEKITEFGGHVARYQDAGRGGQNGGSIWGTVRAVHQQDRTVFAPA